jgi:microcystin-dependent protein
MTDTSKLRRRDFLARALGILTGGAWLGRGAVRDAAAATTQDAPFLGEIRMFSGDFAPVGWAICDGQLLPIVNYDPLFQLIGTTYGGDGQDTFAVPDLRSRAPVHVGLMTALGQTGGQEMVTLQPSQIPGHSHTLLASSAPGDSTNPSGRVPARSAAGAPHYGGGIDSSFAADALTPSGSSAPHDNMMPSLCINFIMCIEGGEFPQPS